MILAQARENTGHLKRTTSVPGIRCDSSSMPGLFCQHAECPRIWAEGVVPFGLSGEPLVAQVLSGALPTPAPHLFHGGVSSWVIVRGHPRVQAAQRHHVPGGLSRDKRQCERTWVPAVRVHTAAPEVEGVSDLFRSQIKPHPITILRRSEFDEPHRLPMEKPETLVRRADTIDLTWLDAGVDMELVC